jgi:hypothetical protein
VKSTHNEISRFAAEDLSLRVSVATLDRVVFPHPNDGTLMLALERKASVVRDVGNNVRVWAQPFGGGVNILNPFPLQEIVGEIQFDSEQSKHERDFRILIPPSKWELVKQYCLRHLENPEDVELETLPHRELVEEFEETVNIHLSQDQYTVQPTGFVIENHPVQTDNAQVRGQLTARLYRIFKVVIIDDALCRTILTASQRYSDQELRRLALKDFQSGNAGRVNTILTLPLKLVLEAYLALPPEKRYQKIVIEDHELDESVLAVLGNIDVPQYQRIEAIRWE